MNLNFSFTAAVIVLGAQEIFDKYCESCECDGGVSCQAECEAHYFLADPSCKYIATLELIQTLSENQFCGISGKYIAQVPLVDLDIPLDYYNWVSNNPAVRDKTNIIIEVDQIQECNLNFDRLALNTIVEMPTGCPVLTPPANATVLVSSEAFVGRTLADLNVYRAIVFDKLNAGTLLEMTPPPDRCGGDLRGIQWRYTMSGYWRFGTRPTTDQPTNRVAATVLCTIWIALVAVIL